MKKNKISMEVRPVQESAPLAPYVFYSPEMDRIATCEIKLDKITTGGWTFRSLSEKSLIIAIDWYYVGEL